MGAEGSYADHKTSRMEISLEGFCSWTIMQDPTQQGAQKGTFLSWNGRLDHPAYSCDLTPSDFHLFPAMKLELSRRHFRINEEVQQL
ncbi:hypothetical protein AVEN_40625-1 [Araneus ventricosus]|uniref:Uncharacterized protein n=1 Tax=Araneus ventricosus TaxID=182803 RepID=A0A4Y2LHW9_ARAVE|nr:hypothetical protein AVEN_40625-1 [Araneus ventricosus]